MLKKTLIVMLFLGVSTQIRAQGGFMFIQLATQMIGSWQEGGYEVKATQFNNEPVFIHGIRGGWFDDENQKFLIGMSGYGASTRINESISLLNSQKLFLLYGTVFLDYSFHLNDRVDINPLLHLGAGFATTSGGNTNGSNLPTIGNYYLLEPNLNATFLLGKKVKIGAGFGYRFLSNMEIRGTDSNLLGGPSVNMFIKFGPYR